MMDTKVETIARLAQWKIESFVPTVPYKRSDPFKIGIWNWHLAVERSRSVYVRLFPEPSRVAKDQPPLARFIIRVTNVGRRPFISPIHERLLRTSDDFACPIDINNQGRFIIDVEFLDLKICPLNRNKMNEWRSDDRKWCYFHPREMVVGVCALCLKERLLVLVAKKNSLHHTHKTFSTLTTKKPPSSSSSLTKIFALTTLLNGLEIKDHKSSAVDDRCSHSSSSSPDDSFISIKFENNGVGSWEKGKLSEIGHDHQHGVSNYNDKKIKSLVEHSKPRGALRWRRRIGHIFHLIRFKKSNKGNICHAGSKPRKSKV